MNICDIEKLAQLYNEPPISYPNDAPNKETQLSTDRYLTFLSVVDISKHNDTNNVLGADTNIPAITLNNNINKGYVFIKPNPN